MPAPFERSRRRAPSRNCTVLPILHGMPMKAIWLRMRRGLPGLLLGVSILAGVLGCGSGAPDSQSNNNPPVGVSEPAGLQTSPVAGNATTAATAKGIPKEPFSGSNHKAMPPDDVKAQERLKELNVWAKQGFAEEDAPLIRALNDPDERVRARAQELMVGDWAAESAAGYPPPR
jgi:hypothetical protein